jgi:hypothetical protein
MGQSSEHPLLALPGSDVRNAPMTYCAIGRQSALGDVASELPDLNPALRLGKPGVAGPSTRSPGIRRRIAPIELGLHPGLDQQVSNNQLIS